MTSHSHTFFSLLLSLAAATNLVAGSVSGRVELRDSQDAAVRKHMDFSGVVVWLEPVTGSPAAAPPGAIAKMVQKDKTFTPHVLPIRVGTSVDFPNFDPIFHNAFSNYNGQLFDVGLYPPGTSRRVHFARPGVVRVFCNIHAAMSAVIVVLNTPYFDTTQKNGSYQFRDVPPGEYTLHFFHERATQATLDSLTRRVTVGRKRHFAGHRYLGKRIYRDSAPQQIRARLHRSARRRRSLPGCSQIMNLKRHSVSLLWRILFSTSIAITVLFAAMGWLLQDQFVRIASATLEDEVRASFRAYESLWRARGDQLASVSLILSRLPSVRSAFGTGDGATIRDSASEVWDQLSRPETLFLVCDPKGVVIASVAGPTGGKTTPHVPDRGGALGRPGVSQAGPGIRHAGRSSVSDRNYAGLCRDHAGFGAPECSGGGNRGGCGSGPRAQGRHRRKRLRLFWRTRRNTEEWPLPRSIRQPSTH